MSKVRERENKKEKLREWFSILEGKSKVVLSPNGYFVISPCLATQHCSKYKWQDTSWLHLYCATLKVLGPISENDFLSLLKRFFPLSYFFFTSFSLTFLFKLMFQISLRPYLNNFIHGKYKIMKSKKKIFIQFLTF